LRPIFSISCTAIEIRIKKAQALCRCFHFFQRRGSRQQQDLVGDLGGGNPDLLAVDEIAVVLSYRAGFQLRGIQAGIGFGHREAGSVGAGYDRRQHPGALFVIAEHDHRIEPEHIHMHGRRARHAGAGFRDRPHHDRGIGDAKPRAAILFGNADAEPAGIGQRPMEVGGIAPLLVLLQPIGIIEARADLADGIADRFLVGAEGEIHLVSILGRPRPW
jgi:hypothetical protein